MKTVLEIKSVSLYVPDGDSIRKVIADCNLSLEKGEVSTITAESSEKSHFLFCITAGDLEPTSGTVIKAEGLTGKMRRESRTFSELSVYENILLACGRIITKETVNGYGLNSDMKASELSSADMVKLLFLQRYLQNPVYIVAEDPFSELSKVEMIETMRFIEKETEKTGISVLIIDTEKTGD